MSVSELPGVDLDRLREYLDAERPGLVRGELSGDLIAGGRSNLTYLITDGARRWVLRRPPLGHVLPTAHDMTREHRVMSALGPTSVPVPATVLLVTDPDVIGAQFYLMDVVPGTVYRTGEELRRLGAERTHAVGLELVDTLVELHAVDPARVGLDDFGRPSGFLERQLRRWSKQLAASRSRDLPGIEELGGRLGDDIPASPAATIVHGDYRLDNVLVDDTGRITAVLDWEMSTLGDPLTDLGLLVAYAERDHGEGSSPVPNVTNAPGYPTSEEVIARYARRSGRDLSRLDWYIAFGYFKIAVILEGIHYRYVHGQTVGENFDRIGELVPPLVERGHAVLAC